ncbi:MAG: hypothetical protein ACO1OQ_13335 [Rufibacter sp.]
MKKSLLTLLVSAFALSFAPAAMAFETAPAAGVEWPIFGKKKSSKAKSSKSKSGQKMKLRKGKTVNKKRF